jgi:hypothetical protein
MTRSHCTLLAGITLCVGCTGGAAKPTVAEVRKKYEQYPSATLKIAEPIEVKSVAYYKDGGSILWVLIGADGTAHRFRTHESPDAPFYYTTRPDEEKGRPLDDGGEELKEVYGVWLRWIQKNVPNAKAFLENNALPATKVDPASLSLSFRALEKRIVVVAEKGISPE